FYRPDSSGKKSKFHSKIIDHLKNIISAQPMGTPQSPASPVPAPSGGPPSSPAAGQATAAAGPPVSPPQAAPAPPPGTPLQGLERATGAQMAQAPEVVQQQAQARMLQTINA